MKFKEHHYSMDFPVLGYKVFIIYTNNLKKSREAISHKIGVYKLDYETTNALHSSNHNVPESFIIFTPDGTVGTIAHEIWHSIWQVFSYYDLQLDNENVAYHLTYMLDKVLEFKNKIDVRSNKNH